MKLGAYGGGRFAALSFQTNDIMRLLDYFTDTVYVLRCEVYDDEHAFSYAHSCDDVWSFHPLILKTMIIQDPPQIYLSHRVVRKVTDCICTQQIYSWT